MIALTSRTRPRKVAGRPGSKTLTNQDEAVVKVGGTYLTIAPENGGEQTRRKKTNVEKIEPKVR